MRSIQASHSLVSSTSDTLNPLIEERVAKCEDVVTKLQQQQAIVALASKEQLNEFKATYWKEIDNIWKV